MPPKESVNWKTPEATTRLVSAIIAAHPELKLNYAAIAEFYGSHCTESALVNRFKRVVNKDVSALRTAVKDGVDPATVELLGVSELAKAFGKPSSEQGIQFRFRSIKQDAAQLRANMVAGIDNHFELHRAFGWSTEAGIRFQIHTRFSGHAKRLREAMDKGIDTKTIDLAQEIARLFGQGCTIPALKCQMSQSFRPKGRMLQDAANAGVEIVLGDQISKCFGNLSTASAIENRFRKIKQDALAIRNAVETGQDPYLLPIGGEIAKLFGGYATGNGVEKRCCSIRADATAFRLAFERGEDPYLVPLGVAEIAKHMEGATQYGLQHKFRSIIRDAKASREKMVKFLPGVTTSALEHRFREPRKQARRWLEEGVAAAGGGAPATPKKGRGGKGAGKGKGKGADDDDEEEAEFTDEEEGASAKKKTPLNKVKAGRVTKGRTPKKSPVKVDLDSDIEETATKVKAEKGHDAKMDDGEGDIYHDASNPYEEEF